MSPAMFQEYWLRHHVSYIKKLPGIRRYVQNHPQPDPGVQPGCEYDGIAELWADNSQAFRDMGASPAYLEVQSDEERFLDRPALALILCSETLVKPGGTGGLKMLDLLRRQPGLEITEFQNYWLEKHGPRVAQLPSLRRYTQSPARLGGYANGRSPPFDGMSSLWFDTAEDMLHALGSDTYADVAADAANFVAPECGQRLICLEHVIIG